MAVLAQVTEKSLCILVQVTVADIAIKGLPVYSPIFSYLSLSSSNAAEQLQSEITVYGLME